MGIHSSYLRQCKEFWEVEDPEERMFNRVDVLSGANRTGAKFRERLLKRTEWLLERNDLAEDAYVLEIGCGIGAIIEEMTKRLPGVRFCGVDIASKMLEEAKKRLGESNRVSFRIVEGDNLSAFANESFDFVFACYVFNHIHDASIVKNYLREVERVLKRGAMFRFSVRYRNLETTFANSIGGRVAKLLFRSGILSSYRARWRPSIPVDFNGLIYTLNEIERLVCMSRLILTDIRLDSGSAFITALKT